VRETSTVLPLPGSLCRMKVLDSVRQCPWEAVPSAMFP
jgi:hypothetical protein